MSAPGCSATGGSSCSDAPPPDRDGAAAARAEAAAIARAVGAGARSLLGQSLAALDGALAAPSARP